MQPDKPIAAEPNSTSDTVIDRFIDALWIEDGLAPLTLAAYRRDLSLYADWLQTAADKAPRQLNFGAIGSVLEAMYHQEINTFIDATLGRQPWLQSYALSQQSSATIAAAERSHLSGRWEPVDPAREPERTLPRRS